MANGLTVRLDYGIPLVSVDNSRNSLQEQGFYFSVRYRKGF
ncbi:surface antigen (D15) [Microcystis aeruginosa NIES-98]|nr:surface antigen (D15) [Microcystis aeruginosa NIES-98]